MEKGSQIMKGVDQSAFARRVGANQERDRTQLDLGALPHALEVLDDEPIDHFPPYHRSMEKSFSAGRLKATPVTYLRRIGGSMSQAIPPFAAGVDVVQAETAKFVYPSIYADRGRDEQENPARRQEAIASADDRWRFLAQGNLRPPYFRANKGCLGIRHV
jgi:hypothetical protein